MTLTKDQERAVRFIKLHKYVILTAGGGTGKTITSLSCFEPDEHVVCLVQSKEIKKQWESYGYNNVDVYTYHEFQKTSIGFVENIIIDEGHKVSNPSSKRYKNIRNKLRKLHFNKIIILTATPVVKNEESIYNMCKLFGNHFPLVQEYSTKTEFLKEFFEYQKEYVFYLNRYQDVPVRLKESHRIRLHNLANIFNFEFYGKFEIIENRISFMKKHMQDYDYLKKESIVGEEIYSAAPKLIGLMQLANSNHKELFITDNDYYEKIEFIKSLPQDKIVITYAFKLEEVMLLDALGDLATDDLFEFKNSNKKYYLRNFNRSEGIDIENANTIVFFSINYSAVNFQQFKWRVTRQSSKYHRIYYYYLVFENTIEPKIYDVVNKKITKNKLIKEVDKYDDPR